MRNLYIVIPQGMKDWEEEIHIWDIAQGNFQKQLNEELGEDEALCDFPDLELGKTLKIRFSAETFQRIEFAKTSRIDSIDRDEVYDEAILEQVPNLDEALKVLSYEELNALFLEEEPDSSKGRKEELEEETKKAKTFTKRKEGKEEPPAEDKPSASESEGKCPHGFTFAQEYDQHDECDDCAAWKDCLAASKNDK